MRPCSMEPLHAPSFPHSALRVIQVAVCLTSSLRLTTDEYSIVEMCPVLLIHSTDGHTCSFQVWVTVDRAAVCICVGLHLSRVEYLGGRLPGLLLCPHRSLHIDLALPWFDL